MLAASLAVLAGGCAPAGHRTEILKSPSSEATAPALRPTKPVVLATWNHGLPANLAGLARLADGGSALDAVEAGCRVVELDCPDMTVGLGSRPDRDGFVTLDASIMTGEGRAGAVAFVRGVVHPISLARLVMERTPHVLLVGAGAEQFARECQVELRAECQRCDAPGGACLSPAAEREWRAWLTEKRYEPKINIENHDTIFQVKS